MTPFWKEESWGYKIYQMKKINFGGLDPLYTLIKASDKVVQIKTTIQACT